MSRTPDTGPGSSQTGPIVIVQAEGEDDFIDMPTTDGITFVADASGTTIAALRAEVNTLTAAYNSLRGKVASIIEATGDRIQ